MSNYIIGQKFGRLTVLHEIEPWRYPSGRTRRRYLTRCECGNTKEVRANDLGVRTFSCGCLRIEKTIKLKYSHGMANTRINNIWVQMKGRCVNPKLDFWHIYGGKGIRVCEEWQRFEPFYKWAIENGYNDNLSIDRIDNNKDYCPSNCKWSTNVEQANNRTSNISISICGEFKTLTNWCRSLGVDWEYAYRTFRRTGDIYQSLKIN